MIKLVNLTPHAVVIFNAQNEIVLTIPPSDQMARCAAVREVLDEVELANNLRVPITQITLGALADLPEPQEGTIFIVSLNAAKAAKLAGRMDDIVVPDDTVRDPTGRIIGCRAFARQ